MKKDLLLKYLIYNHSKKGSIDSETALLRLLETDKRVKVNSNQKEIDLSYKDEQYTLKYNIHLFNESQNNDNYDCITLNIYGERLESIEGFNSIFVKLSNQFKEGIFEKILIYDSISRVYSTRAYESLHDIESKMRSVITLFMSISAGKSWAIDYTKPLTNNKESNSNLNHDFLYQENFDRLTTILFEKFSKDEDEISELFSELESDEPSIDLMRKHIPKSNWERFFKGKMKNIQEDNISKNWNKIYQLRNKIAHSNTFMKNEYQNFSNMIDKMSKVLDDMLEIIEQDSINFTKKDGDLIVDQVIAHNDDYKEFIKNYFEFVKFYEATRAGRSAEINISHDEKETVDILYGEVKDLRNEIVHKNNEKINQNFIKKVENLTFQMKDILQSDDKTDLRDWDTILVPARDKGFKEVFISEKEWYDVRIGKEKLEAIDTEGNKQLKYIAVYRTKPVSAITHWAEIDRIESSDNKLGYKKLIFKGDPVQLKTPVKLNSDKPELAPQNNRYVSIKRLQEVSTLSSLFNDEI